jgi:hypothetical protein
MSDAAPDPILREPTELEAIHGLAGDEASGICYLDLRAIREGRGRIGTSYYEDRYRRVAGEWTFQSRKLQLD